MRALIALALVASTGCLKPASFQCARDSDCTRGGEQGACEAVGRCSFADPTCSSGWRFGDLSGTYANQCVGEEGADGGVHDAAVDSSTGIDAPMADAAAGCPVGYAALPGVTSTHRYRLVATAAGWTNQRAICGAEPANVYLAIPDDVTELQALVTLAAANLWVGISDAANEGMYVTIQGTPAPFLPWSVGEPDNAGNQDCIRALAASAQLETTTCGSLAIAICECEP
jgi:hypothetical protein